MQAARCGRLMGRCMRPGTAAATLAPPRHAPYLPAIMRADAHALHEQITDSVALLRRHL